MSYFPLFIDLQDKACLVVGGGRIALRKLQVLQDFGASLYLTAPQILPEILDIPGIICHRREYSPRDLDGKTLVIAATDDAALNRRIAADCRLRAIPVNAVDQPADCDFIFPAYLKEGEVVAAFSSGGQSPAVVQYLKEQMLPVLTPLIGRLSAFLGELRPQVRRRTGTEEERKRIYRDLLSCGLRRGDIPGREEIARIFPQISEKPNPFA